MKIVIVSILLLLWPAVASPIDVELLWTPCNHQRLSHYKVYETEGSGTRSGACLLVGQVSKDTLSYAMTVNGSTDFTWFIVACDAQDNELKRTLSFRYHYRFFTGGRFQLIGRVTPD